MMMDVPQAPLALQLLHFRLVRRPRPRHLLWRVPIHHHVSPKTHKPIIDPPTP